MHVSKEYPKPSALAFCEDTDMEENTIGAVTQIINPWLYHFERAYHSSQGNIGQEEVRVVPSKDQVAKETAATIGINLETEINTKEGRSSEDLQHSKFICKLI